MQYLCRLECLFITHSSLEGGCKIQILCIERGVPHSLHGMVDFKDRLATKDLANTIADLIPCTR